MNAKFSTPAAGVFCLLSAQIYTANNYPTYSLGVFVVSVFIQIVLIHNFIILLGAENQAKQEALLQQIKENDARQNDLIAKLAAELTKSQQQISELHCAFTDGLAVYDKNLAAAKEEIISQVTDRSDKTLSNIIGEIDSIKAEVVACITTNSEISLKKHDSVKTEVLSELKSLIELMTKELTNSNNKTRSAILDCVKSAVEELNRYITIASNSLKEDIANYDRSLTTLNKAINKQSSSVKTAFDDLTLIVNKTIDGQKTLEKAIAVIKGIADDQSRHLVSIDTKVNYNRVIGHALLEFKNVLEAYDEAAATVMGERVEKVGGLTLRYLNNKIVEEIDAEEKTRTSFAYKGNVLLSSKVFKGDEVVYEYEYYPNKMIKKSSEYKSGKLFMEYGYSDKGEVEEVFTYNNGKKSRVAF